jgi:Zn-dependent protease with chaperone function
MPRPAARAALTLLACVALLAACLPETKFPRPGREETRAEARWQRELVARERVRLVQRILRVAQPLREKNLELCGENIAYGAGFKSFSLKAVQDPVWQRIWAKVLGPEERLQVLIVTESGPAWNAGLRPGDVILSVGNASVPDDPRWLADVDDLVVERIERGETLALGVERAGQAVEIEIVPALQCHFPISLSPLAEINAFASGENLITLQKGMLQFAREDEELALVVGHEMAHHVMGHIPKRMFNYTLAELADGLLGGAIGSLLPVTVFREQVAGPLSVQAEYEADYVGLYMAARAGYDVSRAADLWRRMSVFYPESPEDIARDSTHPAHAKRSVALDLAVEEIEAKRRKGEPLWPELKSHMYEDLVEAAKKKIETLKRRAEHARAEEPPAP